MDYGDQTTQNEAVILPGAKVVQSTRLLEAVTGNIVYTGFGFTPSSLIVFSAQSGTERGNWGMTDGVSQTEIYNSTTSFLYASGSRLLTLDNAGSDQQLGTFGSFNSDGFDIDWVKGGTGSGTIFLKFIAYK